ncbi:inverse autotransporter beta domain-containing protein, partial [Aeromonas veronii]
MQLKIRSHIYFIAWINIVIQSVLPVLVAFSPVVMANAQGDVSLFKSSQRDTKLYRLKGEETPSLIAKKLGLSLADLFELNKDMFFAKPFEDLVAGDEINVPLAGFLFNNDNESVWLNERDVAYLANQFGNAQANGNSGYTAAQMAQSAATQAVNNASEKWLGQFGTARVKIGINDDFSLEGSELDLLLPMYDNGSEFVFAQTGIRRIDERSTLNVGVGIRSFSAESWMLGSNVFFDNDLTGNNARLGVGLEAWTDYLKLAGNFYHGLTDWHQSKDFIDYDERPADGFDLRAEAFLPSLPQLGGKLVFEQYFGDEVALFGNGDTDRQKDPRAVTAALTYSPFPLLATTVEHRIGSAGQNETSLNLGLNYQIGVPLGMQLNPERLSEMRNLVGSKFDLVDRNNQIVLEYKKQDIITASLPPSVEGNSQGEVSVKVDVNSRYGLKEVNWDAAALLSAGGSLDIVGIDQVRVTLPPYQSSVSRDGYDPNRYTLGAVAYDTRGNASERVTTVLVVSQSTGAQIAASDLTVTADGAVANGTATNAVQAVVKNAGGELLSGQTVTFTASNGATVITVI